MKLNKLNMAFITAVLAAYALTAAADTIVTVPVGYPGNAGELSGAGAGGFGPDAIVGGVGYDYLIGKYEITAGQYAEFLNAVADIDTFGLYSTYMWSDSRGCKILRSGASGSYSYSVASDRADRPVNYVSWGDAVRFANWLSNGRPTGAQNLSTTEDGSYYINGATSTGALMTITRKTNATWVIPNEDEWYKAAYHKNDGTTGNYFDYPTGSDIMPSNNLVEPTDPGNNSTFYSNSYTIGSPFWRTEFGAHEYSESPYDTFDQGGNVWEWNETVINSSSRGLRGGSFDNSFGLTASYRYNGDPTIEYPNFGFRVANVPEPGGLAVLAGIAAMGLLCRLRRRA